MVVPSRLGVTSRLRITVWIGASGDAEAIKAKIALVDASKIAMEDMRVPITNTTMLGAFVKAAPGVITMEGLKGPIDNRFGPIAEKNVKSCARAFDETVMEG